MIREEAIKHLEDMKKGLFLWDMTELIDLCISALSENKGEWIPISERLPQIGQYVLCSLKDFADYRIIIAQYNSAKWWDYVEAWQPLPEPYKAESEE